MEDVLISLLIPTQTAMMSSLSFLKFMVNIFLFNLARELPILMIFSKKKKERKQKDSALPHWTSLLFFSPLLHDFCPDLECLLTCLISVQFAPLLTLWSNSTELWFETSSLWIMVLNPLNFSQPPVLVTFYKFWYPLF